MSIVSPPKPETIEKYENAILPAFALLAARQLDLFTPLKDGPMTAEQVAEAIGVNSPKLKLLLYALVTAGLLRVEGKLFSNTDEAQHFLVRGSPAYIGGGSDLDLWAHILGTAFKTADSVRSGFPQAKHDYFTMSEAELESFFRGLHPGALAAGRDLVARYDFSSYHALLDVGGGSGGLAIAMTEACPHLQATIVDLPTVTPITQRFVEEASTRDRLQVMTADVVNESLIGSFDVVVMKAFTQVLSPDQIRRVLTNISKVVTPGGVIYILAHILDNSRFSPPKAAVFNIIFLNLYDEGQAYTEQEYQDWLIEAGFEDFDRVILPTGHSIVKARKSV